jgi:hypothetical protein
MIREAFLEEVILSKGLKEMREQDKWMSEGRAGGEARKNASSYTLGHRDKGER